MRFRILLFILIAFILVSCGGTPDQPTDTPQTILVTPGSSVTPPEGTNYTTPPQTGTLETIESYPSSETFLPIAAYPEPDATALTETYPQPITEPVIEAGPRIRATDPQLVNLQSGIPTLIEFFSSDCGPCLSMLPVIMQLENEYGGEINFIFLDTEDARNDRLMRKLGYRVKPHFFLVDGVGEVLDSWIGQVEYNAFLPAMNSALAPDGDS